MEVVGSGEEGNRTCESTSKVLLVVEYEGTRYHGFQFQPGLATIQGELERAICELTRERVRVVAASRTDSGVHAWGQVVSFRTGSGLPRETFLRGLNHYLPEDIAVRAALGAKSDFDVRRDAHSRQYRYTVLNSESRSPLRRNSAYLVGRPLDIESMQEACQALIGEHDFAPFSGPPAGKCVRFDRTIHKAEVSRKQDFVIFDFVANSFLPQQVRRMVGALMEVGGGKKTVEEFRQMARSKKRGVAGPTAPPHGLCLLRVNYSDLEEM